MDQLVNHYDVLGVPRTATRQEIKGAWSSLVQKYHPDMGPDGDAKKFMEVQKAYEILNDEAKRSEFDAVLDIVEGGPSPANGAAPPAVDEPPPPKTAPNGEWLPPHMRQHPPHAPAQEPQPSPEPAPAPQQQPAASDPVHPPSSERAPTHSKPGLFGSDPSWRSRLNVHMQPKLVKGVLQLWIPPLAGTVVSWLLTGLAITAVWADQWLVAMLSIMLLWIGVGVAVDWYRARLDKAPIIGPAVQTVFALIASVMTYQSGGVFGYVIAAITLGTTLAAGYALHYRYVQTPHMPVKQLKQYVAFGRPGVHAPAPVLQRVEQELAEDLNTLLHIPSVRAYHGLHVPATSQDVRQGTAVQTPYGTPVHEGGYISHCLTAGERAVLLVPVIWSPGHYTQTTYGGLVKDGEYTDIDLDVFEQDLRRWQQATRSAGIDLEMVLVVYSDGHVSFDLPDTGMHCVPAHELVDSLGTWLVDRQDVLDRRTNSVVAAHLASA